MGGPSVVITPEVRQLIDSLYEAIAHGDSDHREWLREAIDNHFKGLPVPPPRGGGLQVPYEPS